MLPLKRIVIDIIAAIAAAIVLVAFVLRLTENRFIYFPPRYPDGFLPASAYPFRFEEVWLKTEDGIKIHTWYLPSSANGPAPAKVILTFHGNAVNLGCLGQGELEFLSRAGPSVLAVEYRGYGRSEGSPDEAGVYRDAEAAWRYLTEERHFAPRDVIIHGQSLGGAVAIWLASQHECGGLIVESSFTSARDMARLVLRLPLMEYVVKTRFESERTIAAVKCPVLIVHGRNDGTIPFAMGERLYAAAPQPKMFYPVADADHNDVFIAGGPPYLTTFRTFIYGQ